MTDRVPQDSLDVLLALPAQERRCRLRREADVWRLTRSHSLHDGTARIESVRFPDLDGALTALRSHIVDEFTRFTEPVLTHLRIGILTYLHGRPGIRQRSATWRNQLQTDVNVFQQACIVCAQAWVQTEQFGQAFGLSPAALPDSEWLGMAITAAREGRTLGNIQIGDLLKEDG